MSEIHTYWLSETVGMLEVGGAISLESQRRIWWLTEHMRGRAGVIEVVPGMNNLAVELDPIAPEPDDLLSLLESAWNASSETVPPIREIEIQVRYGGEEGCDLEEVARHTGLRAEDVVRVHSGAEYTVYFLGFLPGFAYLGGLDARLATPRRHVPRAAVPAGSVGIGGDQTGIYPLVSPGGWQLIGRTSVPLFDPTATPSALLRPGDRVRFVPC